MSSIDRKRQVYGVAILIALEAGFALGWFTSVLVGDGSYNAVAIGALGGVATALATIFLAILTAFLWRGTDRAADAATRAAQIAEIAASAGAETAERQLRAYIQVEGAQLAYVLDGLPSTRPAPGAIARATVRIVNYGQTPARDISLKSLIGIRPWPVDFSTCPPLDIPFRSKTHLGTGSGFNSTAETSGPLDAAMAAGVDSCALAVCFWGEVEYTDVFGKVHRTTFFLENSPGRHDGTMRFLEFGNDAD